MYTHTYLHTHIYAYLLLGLSPAMRVHIALNAPSAIRSEEGEFLWRFRALCVCVCVCVYGCMGMYVWVYGCVGRCVGVCLYVCIKVCMDSIYSTHLHRNCVAPLHCSLLWFLALPIARLAIALHECRAMPSFLSW